MPSLGASSSESLARRIGSGHPIAAIAAAAVLVATCHVPLVGRRYWLLRRTVRRGMRLDFLDSMEPRSWRCLQLHMAERGYPPPGELPTVNSKSRGALAAHLDAGTIAAICELLREEYECLRFPLPLQCALTSPAEATASAGRAAAERASSGRNASDDG